MPSLSSLPAPSDPRDPRDLKSGTIISERNGYYDSQNIVAASVPNTPSGKTPEENSTILSVVLHHSENREGGPGLRLFATHSQDAGRTWKTSERIFGQIAVATD